MIKIEKFYMAGTVDEGHLIIFDRTGEKPWDERLWHHARKVGNYTIIVWGM